MLISKETRNKYLKQQDLMILSIRNSGRIDKKEKSKQAAVGHEQRMYNTDKNVVKKNIMQRTTENTK